MMHDVAQQDVGFGHRDAGVRDIGSSTDSQMQTGEDCRVAGTPCLCLKRHLQPHRVRQTGSRQPPPCDFDENIVEASPPGYGWSRPGGYAAGRETHRILGQAVHVEFGGLETAVIACGIPLGPGVGLARSSARRACPCASIRPSTTKATRSHSSSAVAMSWVVRKIVRPRAFKPRMMSFTFRALTGSRPEVGSSRNSSSGLLINDRAKVSRICIPLEYFPTRVSASSVKADRVPAEPPGPPSRRSRATRRTASSPGR